MTFNAAVYDALIAIGFDIGKAKAAASKFNTTDRAVNWAIELPEDWTPTNASSTKASPSHSPVRDRSIGPHNGSTFTNIAVDPVAVQTALDALLVGKGNMGEGTGGNAGMGAPGGGAGNAVAAGQGGKPMKRVEDMTFEEQMEAAMSNSTQDTGPRYAQSSGFQSHSGFGSGTTSGYGSMANSMTLPPRPAAIADKGPPPPIASSASAFASGPAAAYPPPSDTAPLGSNNPFRGAVPTTQPISTAPPLPIRQPPKLAKDQQPHIDRNAKGFGGTKIGEGPAPGKGVSFGRVSDDAMREEGRMVVRVADEEEDKEDRTRRGRSPTPAAAKRARVADPSPDPIAIVPNARSASSSDPSTSADADIAAAIESSMHSHQAEEERRKARAEEYSIQPDATTSAGTGTDMDVDMLEDEELKIVSVEDEIEDDLIPDREEGQPVVLATKDDTVIYASHILQILSVVPQFRFAIESILLDGLNAQDPHVRRISYIQELYKAMTVGTKAFREISKQIFARFPVMGVMLGGMPDQAREFLTAIVDSWCAVARMMPHDLTSGLMLEAEAYRLLGHPRSLFDSTASSGFRPEADPESKSALHLDRNVSARRLTDCINRFMWGQDQSMGIDSLADIFCLSLKNEHGTELLYLDEELFLDPYLAQNRQSVQVYREVESNVKAELAGLETELDKLIWANVPLKAGGTKRVPIDDMLGSAIAHFEGPNALRGSPDEVTKSDLMVQKLKRDRETLQAAINVKKERHGLLQGQLPDVFKTPELMQHKYLLRGVTFNAGYAGSTAFACYWRDDGGQWWRGQGYQAVKSDINAVNAETMGLWFDGGPYFLVYSRDGPRPADMPFPEEPPRADASDSSDQAMRTPDDNHDHNTSTANAPPDLLGGDSPDVSMLQDPMQAAAVSISHIENAEPSG